MKEVFLNSCIQTLQECKKIHFASGKECLYDGCLMRDYKQLHTNIVQMFKKCSVSARLQTVAYKHYKNVKKTFGFW